MTDGRFTCAQNPAYRSTVFIFILIMASLQTRVELLWRINEERLPRWKKLSLRLFKRLYITVEQFINNNLGSYASALTYNTLLAAVPVMAIIFAVARGFGFDNLIEKRIRTSLEMAPPEITDTILSFVERYLEHTKSGIFLGVGILLLFYTIVNLTMNIETAFNTIWCVRSSRNIYRRITDYISVFLLLPLLMVITSGISIFLISFRDWLSDYVFFSNTVTFAIQLSPVILTSLAFTLLYKLMPNTHVHWRACICPGILAGVIFLGMEYFYIHYQIKLSAYNAIYGSFAALPLFLLFIQMSWYICIIGAQLCYANQSVHEYSFERSTRAMSRRFRDTLSLLLIKRIAHRFADGKTPLSSRALSRETQISNELVTVLLEELVSVGLLAVTHNERGTETLYLPALDTHNLTVGTIIDRLDSHGTEHTSLEWVDRNEDWERIRQVRFHNKNALLLEI